MIQNHPDLDGRYMRWCEHLNVYELVYTGVDFGLSNTTNVSYSNVLVCEDCGDKHLKQSAFDWLPKLIGTRIDG